MKPTQAVPIQAVRGGARTRRDDMVVVEEPLEVRIRYGPVAAQRETTLGLTMRTPGDDFELAAGLLVSEGILARRQDLVHVNYCTSEGERRYDNAVMAELDPGHPYRPTDNERQYLRTSACGICGRASLETLESRARPVRGGPRVASAVLAAMPEAARGQQRVFQETGGLHAAALFAPDGSLRTLREDVGRHNAVDKVVGSEFLAGRLPLSEGLLFVSGRAGYEIVQKAVAAGIPLVAAVGAPTTLAIEAADRFGITLVGFLRPQGYNVYAGGGRVVP